MWYLGRFLVVSIMTIGWNTWLLDDDHLVVTMA
jgi:hypothetical protein